MIHQLSFKSLLSLAICAFALLSTAGLAEKFNVSQGTRTAFGGILVNYGTDRMPVPLTPYNNANWSLGLLLDFGYFVIDDLAILIKAVGETQFTTADRAFFSAGLGAMYVFETDSPIYPYLQATANINWTPVPAPAPAGTHSWAVGVAPQAGILVGLNRHVALDIGLQANILFPFTAGAPTLISSGIGIIGARITI